MAQRAYTLIPAKTPKTHRVKKNEFKVMVPDESFLSETIQFIAANEINNQIRLDNPPQNIIVDNSGVKPITQADYRVTALFSDPKIVAMAAFHVMKELQKLTRKLTGAARGSYQVWTVSDVKDNGKKVLNAATAASPSTLEKIAATLPVGGRIVIVGPLVDYGRKLYWRPATRNPNFNYKGRVSYKPAYDTETGKIFRFKGSRSTNMRDLVLGRVRRRFPGTVIISRWVKTNNTVNGDNRWPGIAIGLKSKGKLK